MDWNNCIPSVISMVSAIGVAIIGAIQFRSRKVEAFRNEGQLIQMEMAQASLNLSMITAKIIAGKANSEEMDPVLDWANAVMIKYCDFLRRNAAAQTS